MLCNSFELNDISFSLCFAAAFLWHGGSFLVDVNAVHQQKEQDEAEMCVYKTVRGRHAEFAHHSN